MPIRIPNRLFARHYDRMAERYEQEMQPRRHAFLEQLSGTVVEIGPGTGANLPHLPQDVQWIGIEPNEHMHPLLREKAAALGREVDLRQLSAGNLPLGDASVDAVLSTLVLCSVPDVAQALTEIRRILKPGGRFLFWEHVIAPTGLALRALQHLVCPLHRVIADGCNTQRDLARDIRCAGFASVELEQIRIPKAAGPVWIRPHIIGVARC
ncbi:MAG: ubiquinone/menaquinone biosynthesis C-methylase UbiE [Chlamydiales bacterium]|jgi:ubiquinone/menaquinone biosynthesis C-methylase UbiE